VAANYLDGADSYLQLSGQQSHQFLVRSAINWRRSQAHAQRAIMLAGNLAARSPRRYADLKSNGAVFFSVAQQESIPYG